MRRMLLLTLIPAIALAGPEFVGDFESGEILFKESTRDGFFIHTLPEKQSGSESVSGGQGGFGPDSGLDTRVITSETVGGETVRPRAGKYFIRSALHKHKDYSELNSGKDKPRSKIYVRGHEVPFDEEGYLGFSIYLPKNMEHETEWTGDRGSTKLLQVQGKGASEIILVFGVYVPSGKSTSHWMVRHSQYDSKGGDTVTHDLGPVELGRWTDFVMRYRFNPFSERTSWGGKVYDGNKGIMQWWRSKGDNMQLVLNLENEPVGRPTTAPINWHFRIYKGNWKEQPSAIDGPIWIGFDEIRYGSTVKGTALADVTAATMPVKIPMPPDIVSR